MCVLCGTILELALGIVILLLKSYAVSVLALAWQPYTYELVALLVVLAGADSTDGYRAAPVVLWLYRLIVLPLWCYGSTDGYRAAPTILDAMMQAYEFGCDNFAEGVVYFEVRPSCTLDLGHAPYGLYG